MFDFLLFCSKDNEYSYTFQILWGRVCKKRGYLALLRLNTRVWRANLIKKTGNKDTERNKVIHYRDE